MEIALDDSNREIFARSIINRLWFRFYGHGLVMRVDQMHANNEASHPKLLQWLTRDLLDHNYDLKRLIRGLVSSRAYSRSSDWKGKEPVKNLFAVAVIRPLTPSQWGVSHRLASNPDALTLGESAEARHKALDIIEAQMRKMFGSLIEQPRDDIQIGVNEPLKLSNDVKLISVTGDKLVAALQKLSKEREQINQSVWSVLSRPATPYEYEIFGSYIGRRNDRVGDALTQIVWALFNSPEFRFNH